MCGESVSAAHCFFITLFCFSRAAAATEGPSGNRPPLRLLLLLHLINPVFPDNEDRAMIEKFFKQRFVGKNLFVLLAVALQSPDVPLLLLKVIFPVNPHTSNLFKVRALVFLKAE